MVNLERVRVGESLEGRLLVSQVERRGSLDRPFVSLTLANRTGRIPTAPFWTEDLGRIAGIGIGDVVEAQGEVTIYRDRRQLSITSIRRLPRGEIDWDEMLPSAGDVTRFWSALDRWRREISSPVLRDTLALFYEDETFRRSYERCPASVSGHHAELGGLLRHTELVLAGVLLHDIGKLEAYSWNGVFRHTARGNLYGHVVLGTLMLEHCVREASPMPCSELELDILHHLILSHHGKLEFGAPVEPMTLEAEVLHHADTVSARTESMSQALINQDNFNSAELVSARGIWQLDRRRVFRGSSDWGR
jgi:3'-5' exoribonuclease